MSIEFIVGNHTIPEVRLVVFDKDGTLIDVHTYWVNMIEFRAERIAMHIGLGSVRKLELMDSMGVDTDRWKIKPEGPVGVKKREIVLGAGVEYLKKQGFSDLTPLFEDVFAEVDNISIERFDEIIVPLDGMPDLFEQLKSNGCMIAIATTDRTERAKLAMRHIGFENAIDFIAGADLVQRTKPARDLGDMITQKLGVPARRSVMVGDAIADIRMGINAEFQASIGVASGLTDAKILGEMTPYVVSSIADLAVRC